MHMKPEPFVLIFLDVNKCIHTHFVWFDACSHFHSGAVCDSPKEEAVHAALTIQRWTRRKAYLVI